MLRLRRVHIHKYRGVLPGEELRFGPEAVFVLGRNGAGKTTFLELLTRLVAFDVPYFMKTEAGEVDIEWETVEDFAGTKLQGEYTLWLRFVQEPGKTPEQATIGRIDMSPATQPPNWRLEGLFKFSPVIFEGYDLRAALIAGQESQGALTAPLKFCLSSDRTLRVSQPGDGAEVSLEIEEGANMVDALLHRVADTIERSKKLSVSGEIRQAWSSLLIEFTQIYIWSFVARFDEALDAFRSIVGGLGPHATIPLAEAYTAGSFGFWHFIPTELLPQNFIDRKSVV